MALFNILVDIAARTANLEAGMKAAVHSVEKFSETVEFAKRGLETAFVGFSVMSVTESIVAATEKMDAFAREASKAGTSVESFQALSYAAHQTDVTAEELANGFKFMNKAIGEAAAGSQSARDKFAEIGVNFERLHALKPEEQFVALGEAINRIKDPAARVRAEIEIFGKAGSQLAPLFERGADGIREMMQEAQNLGVVLGKDQVEAAKQAADSIKQLHSAWEGFTNALATKTAPTLSNIATTMRRFISGSTIQDHINDLQRAMKQNEFMLNAPGVKDNFELTQRYLKEEFDLQQKLYELRRKMNEETATAAKVEEGVVGKAKHRLTAEEISAALPGFNVAAIKDKMIKDSNFDEYWRKLEESTRTGTEAIVADYATFTAGLDELLAEGKISHDEYAARVSDKLDTILKNVDVSAKKLKGHVTDFHDTAIEYGQQTANALENAFAGFFSGTTKGLGGLVKSFANAFNQIIAQAMAKKLMQFLFNSFGGGDSFFSSIFSAGGFAAGGDPPVGKASIVGENGPEIFVPKTAGTIIPNHALGSGGNITVAPTYNIHVDSRSDRSQVQEDIARAVRSGNADLVTTLVRYNPGLKV